MFEYIFEREQKPRALSDAQTEAVAEKVGGLWSEWDQARSKQKNIADKLRPEIYLDERIDDKQDKEAEWKSDVHLNKIYALNQTQQAFIWDNVYSNIEHLFDVEGADEVSAQNATSQKANLVNTFYKMGVQRKIDQAIEYYGAIGEACLFVGWSKKYKQIRRRLEDVTQDDMHNLIYTGGSQVFGVFMQQIYDGANVEAINPLNLVFDPRVVPEDTEKWDSCGKIIKTWETYDSIINNKLYKLSPKQQADLKKELSGDVAKDEDKPQSQKADDVYDNNRVEVLQYWGDYTLDNGTVLKNWHLVVIGRKYLAVFERNRWVINPIINCASLRDADNKRGIPELWSIYDLCKEQENKVNLQNNAQMLNLNPPAYAPEGFFKENKVELFPGKQIEYKQGLEDPSAIIKMSFPLLDNANIIQYYDSTASTVSGIFPNMQGQNEAKDATATEIKVKVQGQTTRLSKILDTIKQNAIVPMVSKVAELEANMKFGEEDIFINQGGQHIGMKIGDVVRQGNYEYKYTDNSGIQKKLGQNQTLTSIFAPVWNDPSVPLNKTEIVKQALNNAGIENADKFFAATSQVLPQPSAPIPGNQTPPAVVQADGITQEAPVDEQA